MHSLRRSERMTRTVPIITLAIGLLLPPMMSAQGTLYLSNLDLPPAGSMATGSNAWLAGSFHAGNMRWTPKSGYEVDQISYDSGVREKG